MITDSQYVANSGKKPWNQCKEHRALWLMFHAYSRQGIRIHWHWNRREQLELNQLGHKLANVSRKRMASDLPESIPDPYDCDRAE